jgi:putative tricarboxylic transport membrane protein
MYAIGILGFFLRRYDFPVGPVVLGVILGPLLEAQFRRALQISQGDMTVFLTRPVSAVILLAAVAAIALPYLPRIVARIQGRKEPQERLVFGEEQD